MISVKKKKNHKKTPRRWQSEPRIEHRIKINYLRDDIAIFFFFEISLTHYEVVSVSKIHFFFFLKISRLPDN